MSSGDTIFALSSGHGRAAIAIVRLSGPECSRIVLDLTGKPPGQARCAALRTLLDPVTGEVVDRGLVVWFPTPASFTGEDMVELHVHGGVAVTTALTESLIRFEGVRPAEAGEFSKRAYLNGKMGLVEVEGLADLISAETPLQRLQALDQLQGSMSARFISWRRELIAISAMFEADIDFSDQDVPDTLQKHARERLSSLAREVGSFLASENRGEIIRQGIRVAIIGPPNVGKSSLLNILAKREVAIVTDVPGTTRDVLEVRLDIDGALVILFDTAGVRDPVDLVEREGIERARQAAQEADLIIALSDVNAEGENILKNLGPLRGVVLSVKNKIDLLNSADQRALQQFGLTISAKTGSGIETLLRELAKAVQDLVPRSGVSAISRPRQRAALEECLKAMKLALTQPDMVLCVEDIRYATNALGRLVGLISAEEILDSIFAEFCIGK
ncbi:MAG: tRNA uridine-5-carboxymethylaminomethyl(34) synthesis GTPase MnmE [Alphaproteobacteria bacterium]